MNILFLTMNPFTDIDMHNIYSDLMKEFIKHGHRPYIVTPREKKSGEVTELLEFETYSLLKVCIGNTSEVSLIEKGFSTVTISGKFYRAIMKYLRQVEFGLILYSTPPITLAEPVKRLKKRFNCRTYLMLKDIFPQNAVDLGMFSKTGVIYKWFRYKEKLLYKISDRIGCMSQANVEYLMKCNTDIDKTKVEICPNAIIPCGEKDKTKERQCLHEKLSIPQETIVYLYGGNLGKPQGIPFLLECLRQNMGRKDAYFIICGTGSELGLIDDFVKLNNPQNVKLIKGLPKEEYDALVCGCDVGLIFLDARFTIPNYPSRILSYMENSMPILLCTDKNTDVGKAPVDNNYGLWCESTDADAFSVCVDMMNSADILKLGKNSRDYLLHHFTADLCYSIIMDIGE